MNDSFIEAALTNAANDFLTTGDAPVIGDAFIAWENRNFDNDKASLWASFFYRPNPPVGVTVGLDGFDIQTGFIQIDINAGTNKGTSEVRAWEDKARIFFAAGNNFDYSGYYVTVTETGMGQGRIVDNHFRRSLTVSFRAQLKRQNTT